MRAIDGCRQAIIAGKLDVRVDRPGQASCWLLLAYLVCGTLTGGTLAGCSSEQATQAAQSTDTANVPAASNSSNSTSASETAEGSRYIGVSSCASVGCHGFSGESTAVAGGSGIEKSDDKKVWRRSFWEWKSQDPHTQAYDVLWWPRSADSPNSQEIIKRLDADAVKSEDAYKAFLLQNCCGCHATGVVPQGADAQIVEPESLSLGVHCEACHGPARDWKTAHLAQSWVHLTKEERKKNGNEMTRDLSVRASMCVKCHIGSLDLPGQEVNHDLIAAGHPRLNFEFSLYLAKLPPHWDADADHAFEVRAVPEENVTAKPRTNFEFEAWQSGQLACADQALKLLSSRAYRAVKPASSAVTGSQRSVLWPEFTEFDCFACHHDLQPSGFRQKRRNDGVLVWGNWYFAMADFWLPAAGSVEKLRKQLGERSAQRSPEEVIAGIAALAGQVASSQKELPKINNTQLPALAKALAASKLPEQGWMEASQWLLAAHACFEASGKPDRTSILDPLYERLAFTCRPAKAPAEPASVRTMNSPGFFDLTDADYVDIVQRIREELTRLTSTRN